MGTERGKACWPTARPEVTRAASSRKSAMRKYKTGERRSMVRARGGGSGVRD